MKIFSTFETIFWKFVNFFEDWIWPAYHIRRLFNRKDIIKLKKVKPWEWCDEREQLLLACQAIVESFFDQEPDKIVCYYKDEKGEDVGPRVKSKSFPEIDGKYFFDVLKDVRDILLYEIPEIDEDIEALLSTSLFLSPRLDLLSDSLEVKEDYSKTPKTWKEAEELILEKCKEDEVRRIRKYIDFEELKKSSEVPIYRKVFNILNTLEEKKSDRIKTALHWLVEIREGLWT